MEHKKEEWIKPEMRVRAMGIEKDLRLAARFEQAPGGLGQNNFGNMDHQEQGIIIHPENE